MSANLEVKWNGKKFPIEFSSVKELEQTSVKELKNKCERITGVKPKDMKINAFGALMNNDDMPLSVYGLRPGCFVTLKANKNGHKRTVSREGTPDSQQNQPKKETPTAATTSTKQPRSANPPSNMPKEASKPQQQPVAELQGEALLLEQLQKIHDKIEKEITPQVIKYQKTVKEFLSQTSKTEKEKKKQVYMGAYLNEQLMHVLFDLDGFTCGPDNLKARQARKEAVKSAQSLLDTVDEIKAAVKNIVVIDAEKE